MLAFASPPKVDRVTAATGNSFCINVLSWFVSSVVRMLLGFSGYELSLDMYFGNEDVYFHNDSL